MKGTIISTDSQIGDYSYIGFNTFITKAVLGRYCSIAANVSIGLGEHIPDNISTNSLFYKNAYHILTEKQCLIGNDVWVGVDSVIRRGVEIGNGAIIGANSFVNKSVPPYAIVGGVPAKLIRYRFSEEQISKIEESKWWEYEYDQAEKILSKLNSTIII